MNSFYLIDTTLRDGEQAPGVSFSYEEKLAIARKLDEIGVEELEVGIPAMGKKEVSEIRSLATEDLHCKLVTWCRALRDDIDAARKTRIQRVHFSLPVSDVQLRAMGKDRAWTMATLREILSYARMFFPYVSVGAQDASRADKSFLMAYTSEAVYLGAHRLRLADTVGCMNPFSVQQMIRDLLPITGQYTEIEFHPHNDLGMATANALSALMAGASAVSVTVNGMGERAGNAALEELIMAIKKSLNREIPYNTTLLSELSHMVYNASGRNIPDTKPVTGNMILTHESGIHTRSLLNNRSAYELFDTNETGIESSFVFGKHSGKAALANLLQTNGIKVYEAALIRCLDFIKQQSAKHKRAYTESEVLNMFQTNFSA